jgi:hypothetical protein
MKKFSRFLVLCALASCIFLFATTAFADITLVDGKWSTTFNCPDWIYPLASADPGCDGLSRDLDGSVGYVSKIISTANNPTGGGGKGFAWQVGNGNVSSTSPTSTNLAIKWSGSTRFWVRWYVRIPPGLSIGYNDPNIQGWKVLYIWDPTRNTSMYINANYNGVGMTIYDRVARIDGGYGFSDAIGSTTANGSWVAVEMEFDIPNRTWRYWFYKNNVDDPTPKFQSSSVNFPMSSIGYLSFPDNIRSSQISGAPATLYFDDIAISVKGRMGPVGSAAAGGDLPASPGALRIVN